MLTKADLVADDDLAECRQRIADASGSVPLAISAPTGAGLEPLLDACLGLLDVRQEDAAAEPDPRWAPIP